MLPSAPLRSQGAADAVPTHAGPRAAKAEAATLAALPIDVIYADDEFLVVDKPPDVRMAGDEFEVTLQKVWSSESGDR
jgi:23S rRNA-/tRNA-specific pseudouridylate synthase